MPNPYNTIATDLNAEEAVISVAFNNAETELQSNSAPSTIFLELYWDGTKISRVFDGAQVSSLAASEQYRLYTQLGGLFNAAMRELLYP